jgi:hypothetical protein
MLEKDQSIFVGLELDTGAVEFLFGTIVHAEDGCYTVELEQPIDSAKADMLASRSDIGIYFDDHNKFMHQPVSIDNINTVDNRLAIAFTPNGEQIAAENREYYRAATDTEGITAKINGFDLCRVLDVSSAGCAIRSIRRYKIGEILSIAIEHQNSKIRGSAKVRSIRQLGPRQFRYGLLCCDRSLTSSLRNGLQRICIAIQRTNLKRSADAA